ncbi:ferroxidase/laccase group [Phlebiopsis gigantea 11061_1 CR5-6]|uniref:laccase n=1 Tax=Phlebiopsis gigantea (strain 11061_1 CR5-6) TaxID=745531 RepID=A0A0C3PEP7_PHLG1|nr:ferroxidase/laccase group [Phlebiopsis gigantea 11061_1 CR5-6]
MAVRTTSRLRYVSLALPMLLVGMAFSRVASATTVSAPPASSFFLNGLKGQAPTTRYYDFVVSERTGSPDGYSKPMLVVNGQWPGPTIEANQGDRLVVKVTNQLANNKTTIHYHGLLQNGTQYWDGVQGVSECGIPPGQSLTYDFPIGTFTGTTWWHGHFDAQYTDGISGALIVHNTDPAPAGFPTWDEEVVLQLSDIYHRSSYSIIADYMAGAQSPLALETPDSGAINGIGQYGGKGDYFDLELQPNKTYRLRLINTGSATDIRFSVDNHALTVIEADGTLLEPYSVTGVDIVPGQRYSVLLTTNQAAGPYWMRVELETAMMIPGTNDDIRGVIRYGTTNTSLPKNITDPGVPGSGLSDLNTTKLAPYTPDLPPARSKFYMSNFTFGLTSTGGVIAYMNGTSWQPLEGTFSLLEVQKTDGKYAPEGSSVQSRDQFFITEDSIETVDLLLVNEGPGDHPFHLHGHRPWIMGSGTGTFDGHELTPANPLRRDTFDIPSQGWMMIRYISDNPGPWTLHCHNAWHMAVGMLLQLNNLPSKALRMKIPQAILDQCKV